MMKKINFILLATLFSIISMISCDDDNDSMPTPEVLNIPSELSIDENGFHPEDIKIANNTVYVSGALTGAIVSFDLTEENPTAQLFAAAEAGYSQAWGLESDDKVLLSLLNNVDFSGNPPGPSKLVEYSLSTGNKTNEWDLPAGTAAHTVSIVDGKYYVTDAFRPTLIEVDPSTGNVNGSWFTSTQLNEGFGATIYNGADGFYAHVETSFWYIPIRNGQPGTMEEVSLSGLSGDPVRVDGSTWVADQNTLYYTYNDVRDPADAGIVYKLEFSESTTAIGSVVSTGLDDPSGIWYLEDNGSEYLFVCESQFGGGSGVSSLEFPFTIQVISL